MSTLPIGARRIAASSLTLLAEGVLRLGLTALVSFWIARELGPEQFGMLNFASALMGVFLTLSALGMEVPGVWRLATPGSRQGALLATMLALRLGAAVLAFVLAVIAALLLQQDDPAALAVTLIVALAILGYAPSVFDLWFKAHVQAGAPALARLLTTLLSSAAKLGCLALGGGVVALAWTVALEAALNSTLLWLAWRRTAHGQSPDLLRPDRPLAHGLVRDSLPHLGSNLAGLVATRLDLLLLGVLTTHAQTGLYGVVQKLSEVACVVPVVLVESVYPALARRVQGPAGTPDAAQGQLLFDLAAAAALLSALCGCLLGGALIGLVFGPAYTGAVPLQQWHVWTCVAAAQGAARQRWLAVQGLQRHAPALALLGAAASLGLNLALIPQWGAAGAVAAALLAPLAASGLGALLIPDLRGIGRMQARAGWPWARLLDLAWRSLQGARR